MESGIESKAKASESTDSGVAPSESEGRSSRPGRSLFPRGLGSKPFPWRVFYRALLMQATFLILALMASGLTARHFFKKQYIQQVKFRLRDTLLMLSRHYPASIDEKWCLGNSRDTEFRITVIRADGLVLCDSHHDPETMENHRNRPEIKAAFANGTGESMRSSATLGVEMLYAARFVLGKDVVLRGAIDLTTLSETMALYDTSLWGGLILIAAAAALWSIWSARTIVFPLGRLLVKTQNAFSAQREPVTKAELTHESSDEWSELESNIESIQRDLVAKAQSLSMEQVQLETIMGAISDAILAVDTHGTPLFFNSRFEVICGAGNLRRQEVRLWEIFRDPEILGAFKAAVEQGKIGDTKAIALEQKDGLKRYYSLAVSPLRTREGVVYGAVGIFHDVTDLKSAEQMRIDFVANATHELRTPLTSIKGFGETLELDVKDGHSANVEFIRAINRNADRLMNLMNDLLDLSSLESTDILHKEALSTEEMTSKIIKQLQAGFDLKKQRLSAVCFASKVYADPNRLEQVLVNLLDNANKYAPVEGEVKVEWAAEGKDTLLRVSNNGPGIPVEHHARLFERFYRVDKARSRDQGGTGLGLAIVKHIMQRHEGAVWVESRPGEGATFICRFPGQVESKITESS